jgi:hypothetical protein
LRFFFAKLASKAPLDRTIGFKMSEEEYAQLDAAAQTSRRSLEWCREVLLASANGQPSKTAGLPDFAIFEGWESRTPAARDPIKGHVQSRTRTTTGLSRNLKLVKLRHSRENR